MPLARLARYRLAQWAGDLRHTGIRVDIAPTLRRVRHEYLVWLPRTEGDKTYRGIRAFHVLPFSPAPDSLSRERMQSAIAIPDK